DPGLAREALFRVFDMFSERSGEHLRYMDGGAFDTGFVLDQALLYPWIARHYVAGTGDESLLDEGLVRQVAYETDAALFTRLHPEHMLCSTELLPSGDAADHAYGTFGNALLRAFAEALPELVPKEHPDDAPPRFTGAGPEVAAAIWQHCVTELDGSPLLASTADLDGASAIYDDPAGSLGLLPFFGFCPEDDPVWTATMEFLRSPRYPLFLSGAVAGVATRSDPGRACLAALCTDLLGPGAADALSRLLLIRFPGGVAAADYDPATGTAGSAHHAALAGFLAWTLVRAAEPRDSARTTRRRRR
ncbi:MAG TPA: glycoside hydrolase family 125 protein, partial [Longimicrobiales bacterium]|nr:glycoside hydrolase family 125 protein [Longimicrobiales bacterium]